MKTRTSKFEIFNIYLILTIVTILTCNKCFSQYIANPSFEGPTGMSVLPNGWTVCDNYSTPDTQPLVNYENHTATNGSTFLSLVGRTNPSPYAGHTEDCETQLLKPLKKGVCYKMQIDVACSKTMRSETWDGTFYYSEPMILKIFGETGTCLETELYFESEPINDEAWKTIEFIFSPTVDAEYLLLQSNFTGLTPNFCSLLLDNIRLTETKMEDIVVLDTTIEYGSSITLSASPGMEYQWSPANTLSCTDCQNTIANPEYTTTYIVSLHDSTNCYDHNEYFKIEVNPFIPNVITPNGDGKNDYFKILGLEKNSSLIITDRQGKVIFNATNYSNTWNGVYDSELLPADTYWYILHCPSMESDIIGFIYLMR